MHLTLYDSVYFSAIRKACVTLPLAVSGLIVTEHNLAISPVAMIATLKSHNNCLLILRPQNARGQKQKKKHPDRV